MADKVTIEISEETLEFIKTLVKLELVRQGYKVNEFSRTKTV